MHRFLFLFGCFCIPATVAQQGSASSPTTNCGSEATWGYTTYSYDGLSRVTLVTDPDGSAIQTAYSGNTTTVTDEAGKKRESVSDGLGRLTEVFNDRLQPCRISVKSSGTAPTVCTDTADIGNLVDYTYSFSSGSDNGNVTSITNNVDNTRGQSFTYDSLNRVITAQTASTYATSPANCWGEQYFYDNQTAGASEAWDSAVYFTVLVRNDEAGGWSPHVHQIFSSRRKRVHTHPAFLFVVRVCWPLNRRCAVFHVRC